MRVGFVAPEGHDAHRTVGTVAEEQRASERLLVGEREVRHLDVQRLQGALRLGDGRAADRRTEGVLDQRGDSPSEHERGEQIGGRAAPEVEARDRERADDALADDPRRSREVR